MPEPNYEEMSVEQLRELALKEGFAEQEQEQEVEATEEKPRDDKGRFAKKEETEEEVVEAPKVYERVIDLGDGSGAQVFRGKTPEELIDNLAKAQENATRKIREQAAELREKKAAAKQAIEDDDKLTDEQKYMLQQRMLTDPMSVIEEFVEKRVQKLTRAQEEARRQELEAETRLKSDSEKFVADTPDYFVSERNGKKMVKWLEIHGLEGNFENLTKAFKDLNESGLLEVKPEEQQESADEEVEVQPERIAPKTEATVIKRKVVGGGLTAKRSAPRVERSTSEPTEEELSKMSTEQLRNLALKAVMGR